jgi:ankyrin repeat protein
MIEPFKFYEDDLKDDPRESERSDEVVRSWLRSDVHYEQELPPRECVNYYNIVAERLLFRRCILGRDEGADFAIGGDARPFGVDGPTLEELQEAGVFICMAFIPLTPDDRNQAPELARLYYVLGLAKKYDSLFETEYERGEEFSGSFFVVGLSDNFSGRKIKGDSWRLAARILEGIAQKRDSKKVCNLATHYIVTGDVTSDGLLKPVEMGSKPNLAKNDFEQFKWIMHKENKESMSMSMDMKNMNKVETPETLEEALELIETMQNKATRSFFRFLEVGDLDGMKEQREIGADWFAADIKTGLMVMPLIGKKVRESLAKTKGMTWTAGKQADKEYPEEFKAFREYQKYDAIYKWLKYEGADWAQMFYVLGKLGLDDVLKQCSRSFAPIGVRNEDDFNALEIALKNRDFKLAEKFYNLGCRYKYCKAVSELGTVTGSDGEQIRKCVLGYLDDGEDFNILKEVIYISADDKGKIEKLKTTLWGWAVFNGDIDVMRKCLEHKVPVNSPLKFLHTTSEHIADLQYLNGKTPLEVVLMSEDIPLECQREAIELLKKFGAAEEVCPSAIIKSRHSSRMDKLRSYTDVCAQCDIAVQDFVPGMETTSMRTTVFGMAVRFVWLDLMERCLELGASPINKIDYLGDGTLYLDYELIESRTPMEIIQGNKTLPSWMLNRAKKLLRKYSNG